MMLQREENLKADQVGKRVIQKHLSSVDFVYRARTDNHSECKGRGLQGQVLLIG